MGKLDNIHLRHAALSNRIVLARFGKDKGVALETRDVMGEFWMTLASYVFDAKMPEKGGRAEVTFGGGDEQFTLVLSRNT